MDLTLIISAILVIMVFSSILYKDNVFFRFAEHTLIPLVLAQLSVAALNTIRTKSFTPLIQGSYLNIVPLLLGMLLFTRLSNKYGWISRIPMAMLMGIGLGLGIRGTVEVNFMGQIQATALPFIGGKYTPIDNIVIIVGTLTTLAFFIFTFWFKGQGSKQFGQIQAVGRYVMMVAFGAYIGNTIQSRLTLIITQINIVVQALGLA